MSILASIYKIFSPKDHNHDSTYSKLGHTHTGLTPAAHTHTKSEITDFAHTHSYSDVGAAAASHSHSEYASSTHTHTASSLGVCGFPNYASGSDISGSYKSNKTWTATSDGWVFAKPSGSASICVNGSSVGIVTGSDAGTINDGFFPVKSGDVLSGGSMSKLIFYAMR